MNHCGKPLPHQGLAHGTTEPLSSPLESARPEPGNGSRQDRTPQHPGMSEPAPSVPRILEGKTGVILGVANKRSIAWGCAKSLADAGMRLAFTYVGERLEKSVRALAEEVPDSIVLPCDVTSEESMDATFKMLKDVVQ